MIKHTELRSGNLLFTETGTPTPIQAAGILAIEKGLLKMLPIPLTPELLERCGFKWDSVPDSDGDEHNIYETNWGDFEVTMPDNDILELEGFRMPHIKHLHQLQNIYFALTGIELEIKL
jgi:hypothetical protein